MVTGRVILTAVLAIANIASAHAQGGSDYGQFAPPDAFAEDPKFAFYGSENEWSRRMFSAENAEKDSKRMGQRLLLELLDGNAQRAVELCEAQLAEEPNDLEALFVLACVRCRQERVADAYDAARQAIQKGMPAERFLAGPVELLAPLVDDARFKQLVGETKARLVHGPMLGQVTDRRASFWLRTAAEAEVAIRVFDREQGGEPLQISKGRTSTAADRTAVLNVTGLKPTTRYFYDVLVSGQLANDGIRVPFTTSPTPGEPAPLRIAFGGCAGYTPMYEGMWDTIASRQPDALLQLGDNVYIDLPEQPGAFHRYTYYQRQSRPEYRKLVASTPVYAIWDDHDAAIDDIWLGPYLDRPAWKMPMLDLFCENWNNPAYGSESAPGCWFKFSAGPVDVFMLDCRFYRTNPFRPVRTMLGAEQKAWLLDGLKSSKATFKLIASSVPWAPEAKPGSRDTWDGFAEEREEIFAEIEKHRIGGVLLLSADRHRSEAWEIKRPGGGAFYDLLSARLTNIHTHECVPGAIFCYNDKCAFGLLTFEERDEPLVRYEVVDIDGRTQHTLTLKLSDLQHGTE